MNVANDIFDCFNIIDDLNIVYEKKKFDSQNYCDVNYDDDLIIKKSIDVYVFIFNEKSIIHNLEKKIFDYFYLTFLSNQKINFFETKTSNFIAFSFTIISCAHKFMKLSNCKIN